MAAVVIAKKMAKLAVGVGAVYVTVQQGIWSSSNDEGSKVLGNIKSTILPPSSAEYFAKIPSKHELNESMHVFWNQGITKAFGCVAEASDLGKKAFDKTKSFITGK